MGFLTLWADGLRRLLAWPEILAPLFYIFNLYRGLFCNTVAKNDKKSYPMGKLRR